VAVHGSNLVEMSPRNHESGTIFWRGRTSLHITFDFPSGLLTAQSSTRQHAGTPNLRHGSSIKLSCRRHWMSWGWGGGGGGGWNHTRN